MRSIDRVRIWVSVLALLFVHAAVAGIVDRVQRARPAGVDVVAYPMEVENVVTMVGTLPAGDSYARENIAAATLVAMLLDKGTTKQDKLSIAKQLDDVGASIRFSAGPQAVTVEARFLQKDLPLVVRLLAEQLRFPAFRGEELDIAKTAVIAQVRREQQETNAQAAGIFSRAVFPAGHPNRKPESKDVMDAIGRVTVEDLRKFHGAYYGPAHLSLIFVGDVAVKSIGAEVARQFAGWRGGVELDRAVRPVTMADGREQSISLADKTSVSVLIGQATGLRYQDADALALSVGTAILGSGFTGRLMSTVRDREGLTYGIYAAASEDAFVDGSWSVTATFAPDLLSKGLESTRREILKWWQDGITPAELEARKTNLVGRFRVSLASTRGMANALLQTLERGKPLSWLDQYPQAVSALTAERVNLAIRKYLDPERMVLVKAGTLQSR